VLFPFKTERVLFYVINKAFSRLKQKVLTALLPCGVLKQAARPWSSYGLETQIYGFF